MSLPEHLDYDEVSDEGPDETTWFPLVRCTIDGCTWTREADWSELGDESFGADWNAEHPPHGKGSP